MRIAVCDDTPMEADFLREGLKAQSAAHPMEVAVFGSAGALLAAMEAGAAFDLCFLDILLPDMDGLELARRLTQDGTGPLVAFLSNAPEFADAAAGLGALAYLAKPVKSAALAGVLADAAARLKDRAARPPEAVLDLPGGVRAPLGEIAALTREGGGLCWRLADGRAITQREGRLEQAAAPLLADGRFLQAGRAAVVNMARVQRLDEAGFTLPGGARVPVPRLRARAVFRAYMAYLAGGGRP